MTSPKLFQCQSCQMNAHSNYLICAIHPTGPGEKQCPDYAPEPGHDREQWQPEGAAYYNGELVLSRRISVNQQLSLLENHPIFTGCCPRCGHTYGDRDYSAIVHWDCSVCGWMDDSI
ncbi:DUF6464 family protein [Synechococcus sp. PCC 6312]|uniref:DUF6464 family protein n=1 Tax=Synechococcus sp. (strain ATCC 27167 / PCC 6312) TaxID=195253 RepID=UPI00029ED6BD|nr:DUF6464 family protein [Synechococcus sp. PCC 6312]AFY62777.1 hypothetical protein Syn6312_3767 [Synechococcus sp. PCC 6312]